MDYSATEDHIFVINKDLLKNITQQHMQIHTHTHTHTHTASSLTIGSGLRHAHPGRKGKQAPCGAGKQYLCWGPEALSPARACSGVGPRSHWKCRAWGSQCGACHWHRISHRLPGWRWNRPVLITIPVISSSITIPGATTFLTTEPSALTTKDTYLAGLLWRLYKVSGSSME